MVKEVEANLCFSILGKISKIQNGRHFWGGGKFFFKLPRVHYLDTLWVENFDKIALPHTVKKIEANLCFSIFGKKRKFKMAAIFGERKFLLENYEEYISYIPCGSKILTKSLYLARLRR